MYMSAAKEQRLESQRLVDQSLRQLLQLKANCQRWVSEIGEPPEESALLSKLGYSMIPQIGTNFPRGDFQLWLVDQEIIRNTWKGPFCYHVSGYDSLASFENGVSLIPTIIQESKEIVNSKYFQSRIFRIFAEALNIPTGNLNLFLFSSARANADIVRDINSMRGLKRKDIIELFLNPIFDFKLNHNFNISLQLKDWVFNQESHFRYPNRKLAESPLVRTIVDYVSTAFGNLGFVSDGWLTSLKEKITSLYAWSKEGSTPNDSLQKAKDLINQRLSELASEFNKLPVTVRETVFTGYCQDGVVYQIDIASLMEYNAVILGGRKYLLMSMGNRRVDQLIQTSFIPFESIKGIYSSNPPNSFNHSIEFMRTIDRYYINNEFYSALEREAWIEGSTPSDPRNFKDPLCKFYYDGLPWSEIFVSGEHRMFPLYLLNHMRKRRNSLHTAFWNPKLMFPKGASISEVEFEIASLNAIDYSWPGLYPK